MQHIKDEKFVRLFGANVRKVRESKGLTQLDLGLLCDNHAEQIGRIERGERNVGLSTMRMIANALQVPLSEIILNTEIDYNKKYKK